MAAIWLPPVPLHAQFRVLVLVLSLARFSLSRATTRVRARSRSLLLVLSCSFSLARFLLLVLVLVLTLSFSLLHASLSRSRSPSHVCSWSFSLLHTSLSLVSFSRSFAPTRVRARDPLVLVLSCLSACLPQLPVSVACISSLTHFSAPLLHSCTKSAYYTQFVIKKNNLVHDKTNFSIFFVQNLSFLCLF